MEFQRFKARLDLIDSLLDQMDPAADRVQYLRRTVFVLRQMVGDGMDLPSPYGPATPIARFSMQ